MQKSLEPYIVTLWNGREPADAPPDVQELVHQRGRQRGQSNIQVFILNPQGKLIHGFDGMTDRHPGDMYQIKKRMPGYFVQELERAARSLGTIPARQSTRSHQLPTVQGDGVPAGMRIYVTCGQNRLGHFQVPVVETAKLTQEQRAALAYTNQTRKIPAQTLRSWLAVMYPPAVMDGHGGMNQVTGELVWQAAGENDTARFATLRGTIRFELDNRSRITYQGPLELVLRYGKLGDSLEEVRGVLETKFPRMDQRGGVAEKVTMKVALESLPGK